jgi:regulator of RNase E activity RraA
VYLVLCCTVPFAPTSPFSGSAEALPKIIAPASTLKLISKGDSSSFADLEEFAVPKGQHWVDRTEEGTIVVIEQPQGQTCAAIGGIMANKMQKNGVRGCVVGGRVRDLAELKSSGLPVSTYFFTFLLVFISSNTVPFPLVFFHPPTANSRHGDKD